MKNWLVMRGPAFLPTTLLPYEAFSTEKELTDALKRNPTDLVIYFELACEDNIWFVEHIKIIRSLLRWGAKTFFLNLLPLDLAKKMVKAIQQQYVLFEPLLYFKSALFFTVFVSVEKEKFLVNSLLFGISSSFFNHLFRSQCFEKLTNECTLSNVKAFLFKLVKKHIENGQIDDLWRYEYNDILSLMRLARSWNIQELVKECTLLLKRYIDRNNVISTLLKANQENFIEWKEECILFFNQQDWGLRFLPGVDKELRVEVLNFQQETLDLFTEISTEVTHLAFKRQLSENSFFKSFVDICPKLVGVDLSTSLKYTNQFECFPKQLTYLNVSDCIWLSVEHLKTIINLFPHLSSIDLGSNVQLNYLCWIELQHFNYLTSLSIAHCYQINEKDLKLIARACPHLIELDMQSCRNINDNGLREVLQYCKQLSKLNISYCTSLTDSTLADIALYAKNLTHLTMNGCSFTDKGLLQLAKLAPSLTR